MKTFKQSASSFIEVAALLSLLSHKEPFLRHEASRLNPGEILERSVSSTNI